MKLPSSARGGHGLHRDNKHPSRPSAVTEHPTACSMQKLHSVCINLGLGQLPDATLSRPPEPPSPPLTATKAVVTDRVLQGPLVGRVALLLMQISPVKPAAPKLKKLDQRLTSFGLRHRSVRCLRQAESRSLGLFAKATYGCTECTT